MDHLATIEDPCHPRGLRYHLTTLLALCVCALTTVGHNTTTAITEWAHNAPSHVLLRLGLPACPFKRKADHFLAFAGIACTLICYRRLAK
jgi:hypothetical protein